MKAGTAVRLVALGMAFCLPTASSAAHAPPAAVAARPSADLQTIADYFVVPLQMTRMMMSVELKAHEKLQADPAWQENERAFPGITEVRMAALRQSLLQAAPAVIAGLRENVIAFFSSRLDARELKLYAAYLRTSYPRRETITPIVPRPGEKIADAAFRKGNEVRATQTRAERRREAIFFATPVGEKISALAPALLASHEAALTEHLDRRGFEAIQASGDAAIAYARGLVGK